MSQHSRMNEFKCGLLSLMLHVTIVIVNVEQAAGEKIGDNFTFCSHMC